MVADRPARKRIMIYKKGQRNIPIPLHHAPPTEKPHDPWTSLKGAEHDCHPPVLVHVADGLAAGAGAVDVGGLVGGEDAEGC